MNKIRIKDMKNNNILPSTKIIDIDKVIFVDTIKHVHNWWGLPIKYNDGRVIELVYYTEEGAKRDRDYILRNVRKFEKYLS